MCSEEQELKQEEILQEEQVCDCGCHGEEHYETCKCKQEGHECNCHEECDCHEDNCSCGEECDCHEHEQKQDLAQEYLSLARQIQADFENFRRHALEDIKEAKVSGQTSVIEVFLPCLDTFKEAKKTIADEMVLTGVEMIENKILDALKSLGVEKITSIGEVYNPHFHDVIAVMQDSEKDNDVILEEYQAGYTFKGKVIRHAKVIVNQK